MIFVRRLIWDAWNVAHISRHGIIPEEVEQVCQGDFIVRQAKKARLMVTGPTRAGRVLAVILDPEDEEDVYYPVTARSADRKERQIYRQQRGGGMR